LTVRIEDEELLAVASELPVASTYRRRGLSWQNARSLCGPTSAVNVLRSLGEPVEPRTLLERTGLSSLFGVRLGGMTLDQVAEVVRKRSSRRATVLRDLSLDDFRQHLHQTNDPARRYIVNFNRRPIFAWGGGHHSPLVGYLADEDIALIYDTNRRVGPWLVGAASLHGVVATVDPVSRRSRGLLLVE
jgi:hypothetical protein